jgi:cupin fold WbuC family metalloprotein
MTKKMIHINDTIIQPLIKQARSSTRKRQNHNFHPASSDPMHRMLHAMEPDTYVQPHKHEAPDKREAFIILKGRVAAVEYTDEGKVCDWIILDPATGNYGMEIAPRKWHNLIALESGTVVYEVKDGPWNQADDKFFASWAPKEGDADCLEYNSKILEKVGIVATKKF